MVGSCGLLHRSRDDLLVTQSSMILVVLSTLYMKQTGHSCQSVVL